MNYTTEQVVNGLINYADNEVMQKLPTSGKWVMGTMLCLSNNKAKHLIDELKENTIVTMLGLVDEDDRIDVDAIISAMKQSSDKYGKMTLDIPLVGSLTFSSADIEKLKAYIK